MRKAVAIAALMLVSAGCSEGLIGDDGGAPGAGGETVAAPGAGGREAGGAEPLAAGAAGGGGAGGGELAPCPDDMVLADDGSVEVCIDRFEAPNVEGAEPLAMQTAYDGERWCGQRGKRLCSDVEWMAACKGSQDHGYPYGDDWEAHRCNDDKVWKSPSWGTLASWPSAEAIAEAERLYQADPSGARGGCVSDAGAFDLTGNVAEWVVRTIDNANNYDHVMKGCYWAGCYGGSHPSCGFVNPAHPGGFRSYEAGFRCCRDPQ